MAITLAAQGQLAMARNLAHLMDTAFQIPGTKTRMGLDAILGLVPVLGDAIGSLIGGYVVLVASQLGVPRAVLWRMVWNLGFDAVIGVVPLVGDVLDVAWKANVKNVALIDWALANPHAARRGSTWVLVGIGVVVLLLGVAGAAGIWLLIRMLGTHSG